MKKSTFLLTALLISMMSLAAEYAKVTTAPEDWSGEYLLVYENETSAHVWTGVDAARCYVEATIEDGKIYGDDLTTITIAPMEGGYSILTNGGDNNGKYICGKSGSNILQFNADAQLNTLAYDAENGGVLITSNTSVMRFNKASNNMRFRYFQESTYTKQQIVQLYKKAEATIEPEAEPKVQSGIFSVAADKQIEFAPGNLQFHTGDSTWRFASQQYNYVGKQNIELGNPEFKGWIDMFGWSSESTYFGVNPSNDNNTYTGEFVDWGTLFEGEDWYTLSKEEWKYLLEQRTNAKNLQQVAMLDTTLGILLFPDNWTTPEGCTPKDMTYQYEEEEYQDYNYGYKLYTLDQWTKLEAAGAIFLPAAGRRTGGWGNTTISPHMIGKVELDADGHYKHFDNDNYAAYYWTNTKNEKDTINYVTNFRVTKITETDTIYSIGAAHPYWGDEARCGLSVRLAREYVPRYTVTTSDNTDSNEPLTTGAGEYKEGDEVTVTAVKEIEGWAFYCWKENDSIVSYTADYTFTVEGNVELVAVYSIIIEAAVTDMTFNQETATITGTTQLPAGTLQANFILGEGDGMIFMLADNSTLTLVNGENTQEITIIEGYVMILAENYMLAFLEAEWGDTLARITLEMTSTGGNTNVDNITTTLAPRKVIENGQVFIIRNGVKYNAQGAVVK